jgi:hypothetical protein
MYLLPNNIILNGDIAPINEANVHFSQPLTIFKPIPLTLGSTSILHLGRSIQKATRLQHRRKHHFPPHHRGCIVNCYRIRNPSRYKLEGQFGGRKHRVKITSMTRPGCCFLFCVDDPPTINQHGPVLDWGVWDNPPFIIQGMAKRRFFISLLGKPISCTGKGFYLRHREDTTLCGSWDHSSYVHGHLLFNLVIF